MKSENHKIFNHNDQAHNYDNNVNNEKDPVREGYEQTLEKIIQRANITEHSKVLEFGSGTGNLSSRIKDCKKIICVDLSEKMEEQSKEKCKHLRNKTFIQADCLEYFDLHNEKFDIIISSYALHHLTEKEKIKFLHNAVERLTDKGKIIIGDLMITNSGELEKVKDKYRKFTSVYSSLIDEFYWLTKDIKEQVKTKFKSIEIKKISELSSIMIFEK